MRRFYSLVLAVFAMSLIGHFASAQVADSIATEIDSIVVSSDPEWYVAPEIPLPLRAPKRATAAAGCPLDSVLTFNFDSLLTEITIYDMIVDTSRTTVWTVDPQTGVYTGKSREERYTSSLKELTANYIWDNTTRTWNGNKKSEYVYKYFGSKKQLISETKFIWLNSAWVADYRQTYNFDNAAREIEYYEYQRNTTTNQLEKTKGREQEWYDEETKTKEILYEAFVNNQPTEGTWTEQHFDANGNKTLDMYYPSMVNGAWVGQDKEEWAYADTVLTMNAKYAWGETDWVGTFKEEWGYTDSVLTMNAKYAWGETDWVGTFKEEWGYTDKVLTTNAKYAWGGTDWVGTLKEVWGYTNDTLTMYENYTTYTNGKWIGYREQFTYTNGEKNYYLKQTGSADNWKNSIQETWEYNGPNGDKTYYEKQVWRNNAWGDSIREIWEFNGPDGKETLHERYSWNTSAAALLKSLEYTDEYDGDGHLIRRERYTFTNGVRKGTTYYTYTYVNGKKTAYTVYAWDETISAWVGDKDEHWGYNGPSSKQTLHEKFEWENGDWVLILQDSTEYTGSNITKKENYERIGGVWTGTQKEEYSYNGTKKVEAITYNWVNSAWVEDTKETWNPSSTKPTKHEMFSWNGEWVKTLEENTTYDGSNITSIVNYELLEGVWTGTKGEEYTYTDGLKTRTIIYAWENNDWVESTKEEWGFTSGKETLHEQFTWTGSWTKTLQENTVYDGAKKVLVENYALIEGVWTGTKKEVWGYTSGRQTLHETYEWYNNDWSITLREKSAFDEEGNQVLVENYTGSNGVVVGTEREIWNYDGGHVALHEQFAWSGSWTITLQEITTYHGDTVIGIENYTFQDNNWLVEKEDYGYTDGVMTQLIVYAWVNNAWVYSTKTNAGYQNGDTIVSATNYTWGGSAWQGFGTRTLTAYDDNNRVTELLTQNWPNGATEWTNATIAQHTFNNDGEEVLTYNASWDGAQWVMTSMNRTDIIKDSENRQLLHATWQCNANGVWKGVQKDTTVYSASGNTLYNARFTGWKNNKWTYANGSFESTNVYNAAGTLTEEQRYQWKSNQWQGVRWNIYEFYADGNPKTTTTYKWDSRKSQWTGNSQSSWEYNADGMVSASISYYWDNNEWNKDERTLFEYDASGHVIEQISQSWSGDAWENTTRFEKEYKGKILIKDNTYTWRNNEWQISKLNELYYDAEIGDQLRREVTGAWVFGAVYTYSDKHYMYGCDALTIRFVNYDGTVLETQTLDKGATPVYTGLTPTKPADVENSYTFAGWTPAVTEVTGNATYTATFTAAKNSYTITWLNADSTLIDQTSVEYGVMPEHDDATKTNTAEYTYTFAGWTPGLGIVTGDATYVATFDSTKNSYTITWLNEDETLIDQTTVEYGVLPSHDDVSKAATDEHSYIFAGWTPELVAVTANATYKATFTAAKKSYAVTWLNADSTLIDQTSVEYGVMPEHDDATKAATAQYTYTFSGWTPAVLSVTGEATYKATFDSTMNAYTVIFRNGDQVLQSTDVEYGASPSYTGATPTKDATAQYTYTFKEWAPAIEAVTGIATYTAEFDSTVNAYLISFVNGEETLQSTDVPYGDIPAYAGETPTKPADSQYSYTFSGWSPAVAAVTGAATYTATYTTSVRTYAIVFANYDGEELQRTEEPGGAMPAYNGLTPTKPANDQYSYTFKSWDAPIVAVTDDATYIATYDSIIRTYTVTFYFGDGMTILEQMELEYGAMPEMAQEPARLADPEFSYEFAGWDPEISMVTGDAAYTASYTATVNSYTIIFRNDDGTELQREVLEYGYMPIYVGEEPTKQEDERYTYTFAGWKPAVGIAKADAVYTAYYTATKKKQQGLEDIEAGASAAKLYIEGNIYILRAGHAYAPDGTKLY